MRVDPRSRRGPAAGKSKKFSDGQWDSLVTAFRENPGDTRLVAEITGIKFARCVRAWHHGYPVQGRLPISEIVESDKMLARAKRAELNDEEEGRSEPPPKAKFVSVPPGGLEQTAEVVSPEHKRVMAAMLERDKQRRKALEDSARTRAEEGRLIQVSRRNVMSLGLTAARILRGAEQLATRMEGQLAKETNLPLKEAMSLVQKASVIVRLGTEAGKMAVQMERLAMGQPIGDGTDVGGAGGKLSPDDAERWIEMTMRALERSKRRQRDLVNDEEESIPAGSDEPEPPRQLPSGGPDAGIVRVGRPADDLN